MKIIIEQENRKFSLELLEDLDIHDMLDEMKLILLAMTYSSEVIEDGILEMAEEIKRKHDTKKTE